MSISQNFDDILTTLEDQATLQGRVTDPRIIDRNLFKLVATSLAVKITANRWVSPDDFSAYVEDLIDSIAGTTAALGSKTGAVV